MPSPLYQQFQPQNPLLQRLQQLKQNPMAVVSQRFNVPQNMNDPNQIIQHLLNTHQVTQEQVNNIYNKLPQIQNFLR